MKDDSAPQQTSCGHHVLDGVEMAALLGERPKVVRNTYLRVSPEEAASIPVTEKWSVRDELAHLLYWAEEIEKEVQLIAEQSEPALSWEIATDSSPHGYDVWNEARLKELEGLTVPDLLDRYDRCIERFVVMVSCLTVQQRARKIHIPFEGDRTASDLVSILVLHEQRHIARSEAIINAYCCS